MSCSPTLHTYSLQHQINKNIVFYVQYWILVVVIYQIPVWNTSMEFHGKSMEIYGNPWNSMEVHGIPWSSKEYHGVLRSSMKYWWSCQKYIYIYIYIENWFLSRAVCHLTFKIIVAFKIWEGHCYQQYAVASLYWHSGYSYRTRTTTCICYDIRDQVCTWNLYGQQIFMEV